MDPKLAEAYKTNQADDTDAETLATAALAEKLAASDEINVDGMSDEEAEALATEILGTNSEETPAEPEAEAAPAEEGEKTAGQEGEEGGEQKLTPEQEKIAEADYLGRVMAHAYAQERKEIEKAASAEQTKAKTAGKLDNLKGGAKKAGGKVMEHLKAHGKHMGGAAAAGAAAGAAATHKMHKKAEAEVEPAADEKLSSLDTLALARAQEILKENGFTPEEQEKKSSIDEEKAALLAAKVEERAQAMLTEAGYTFEQPTEETPAEGAKE